MANLVVWDLVDELLALVRYGVGTAEQNESCLARLLDALALARHDLRVVLDGTEYPQPPDWPYAERRALVAERFPAYGFYNVVLNVAEEVGKAELGVGDAIDDIADIAGDLAGVAWARRNTSEADALWHFEFTFHSHWGQHLRDLQQYIHSLESRS